MASAQFRARRQGPSQATGNAEPPRLPPARPKVAITDISAQVVQEPVSKRSYVIVTVMTDAGITGIGEAVTRPDLATAIARIMAQKQTLVGQDATAAEVARKALLSTTGGANAQLPAVQAAVNMALLDIMGKVAKAPVYEVLGGPTRDKVRALAYLDTVSTRNF